MILNNITRQLVIVKNTNSPLIDEAYFLLKKPEKGTVNIKDGDLAAEAERIINEFTRTQSENYRADREHILRAMQDTAELEVQKQKNIRAAAENPLFPGSPAYEGAHTSEGHSAQSGAQRHSFVGYPSGQSLRERRRRTTYTAVCAFLCGAAVMALLEIILRLLEAADVL